MKRIVSGFSKIWQQPRPLRFIVSRLLLWSGVAAPVAAVFSKEPLVRVWLTPNPIAHTAWLGEAEPLEVAVFKQYIKPTDTVFDVGANVGTHALLAAKLAPQGQVFAFEPGARAFAALEKNARLNKVENITLYNAAVSNETGSWTLHQPGRSDEQSFLVPAAGAGAAIKTVALESILRDKNLTTINFLKIDVEGAELLVLRSLSVGLAKVEKIFFENIPWAMERFQYTQAELTAFLREQGFTLFDVGIAAGEVTLQPIDNLEKAAPNVLAIRQ